MKKYLIYLKCEKSEYTFAFWQEILFAGGRAYTHKYGSFSAKQINALSKQNSKRSGGSNVPV